MKCVTNSFWLQRPAAAPRSDMRCPPLLDGALRPPRVQTSMSPLTSGSSSRGGSGGGTPRDGSWRARTTTVHRGRHRAGGEGAAPSSRLSARLAGGPSETLCSRPCSRRPGNTTGVRSTSSRRGRGRRRWTWTRTRRSQTRWRSTSTGCARRASRPRSGGIASTASSSSDVLTCGATGAPWAPREPPCWAGLACRPLGYGIPRPPRSRTYLIATHLLEINPVMSLAICLQVDTYCRPSELLGIPERGPAEATAACLKAVRARAAGA